jgi:hypothetical protein
LSPTRFGWTLIHGVGGEIRELVVSREIPSGTRANCSPTVLDVLGRMCWLRQIVEDDILGLVTEAHYKGIPWADIAHRLDRSKQGVHQRYSRLVHAKATHQRLAAELKEAAERAGQRGNSQ